MNGTQALVSLGVAGCLLATVAAQDAQKDLQLQTRQITINGKKITGERGVLTVPENRNRDDSGTIQLAFVRLRSPSEDPGPPLVYLAGGPGGAATPIVNSRVQMQQFAPLLELGDLIFLDQRGTGKSKPNLLYVSNRDMPPGVLESEEIARELVREQARTAIDHFRAKGVDLAGYTTVESADDVNDLRIALGADKVNLMGFSYGTHLGLTIIKRHGQHVANAILIGVEGLDQTYKLPLAANIQLEKISKLAAADPNVGKFVPDMIELLGRVLKKLEREPMKITVSNPVSGQEMEVAVGKFGLQLMLRFDLGDASDIVVFPRLLYSIDQGDPALLKWFIQKRMRLLAGVQLMSLVMDGASGASPGRLAQIDAETPDCLLGGTVNFPFPDAFEVAEMPPLDDSFRQPFVSDVRTLFLTGTMDWNTPPYQAEQTRWGFTNATHITVKNAGHEQVLPRPDIRQVLHNFLDGQEVGDREITAAPLRFVPIDRFDPDLTHPSVPRR